MYTIKAIIDGVTYPLHNPRVKALIVGDPYFEIGDNINGQAEFTVYPEHPYYSKVKKLTTDIVFYNDDNEEFAGRVLYDDEDFRGVKKVFVEGELAYFCDSVQRPKVYHDTTVRAYLQNLINNHNAQVEERKQFQLGRVTVTDPNDSLYRYSNWDTSRECLSDKLVDRLGGHLVIRKEDGVRYLDYLSDDDFYTKSTQTIRFGKNLLDFARNIDASDIATCIIPLGAKLDEENQDESLESISDDQRLTIADINGGVDYVTDDNAVAAYGKIYKTVTWDDVTVASNLKKKGQEYLASTQFENMVLELNAIDMSLAGEDVEELAIGNQVRCISEPHGLDSWLPLSKKKVYCMSFKKNTLTLGTEASNATYTSSNQQTTTSIEETIASIPGKKEILQQALKDAQELINAQVASGYAIHEPNEFIVADNINYKTKAENLWRWGLGGLAHYSEGYDGPINGIALTMDGQINGKMLMVGSVYAESLDIGYRQEVESAIEESETAAKDYADDQVRVAKQTIENSITNLENRINLSVSSVKETIVQKNYVTSGEEEKLDADAFTVSGSYATVEEAEYLNQNCIKLTFTGTGIIYLNQDLGTLPAGDYKIAVQAAFADTATRPNYIAYGFSSNRSTAWFSSYTAGEFHVFSKTVSVTAASRTVSVGVYGSAGKVVYLTNIRCLRDFQELLDDLDASLTVSIGEVQATVTDVYENSQHDYCVNGDFSDSDDAFTSWYRYNSTYVTQTEFSDLSCAEIANTSALKCYVRQTIKNPKAGPFKVRFKAACAPGYESTARIRVYFGGTNKYTTAGELSTDWQTFEFDFSSVSVANWYCYFYNYVYSTTVYITDIEIFGYMSAYSESQLTVLQDSIKAEVTRALGAEETLRAAIEVNADSITSCVTKGTVGSYITQYYNNVIVAFNNSSKYVQINAGNIAIYDASISDSKKRAVFDQNGNKFYRDGYYVGKIGTNQWSSNNAHKGIVFDLETKGKYMCWAYKAASGNSNYNTVLCFSRANSIYDELGLHCGCNLYGEWFTLKDFKIGSISAGGYTGYTGAIPIVTALTISATSNGGVSWSYSTSKLRVYNGIVAGYWK